MLGLFSVRHSRPSQETLGIDDATENCKAAAIDRLAMSKLEEGRYQLPTQHTQKAWR
jgi:hypothetical protein